MNQRLAVVILWSQLSSRHLEVSNKAVPDSHERLLPLAVPVSFYLGLSAAREGRGESRPRNFSKSHFPKAKSDSFCVSRTDGMSLGNVNTVRPQLSASCDAEAHFGGHEKTCL